VNNTVKTTTIDAATRALIVSNLARALADRWRRDHHPENENARAVDQTGERHEGGNNDVGERRPESTTPYR
jgi:hypothetical protein